MRDEWLAHQEEKRRYPGRFRLAGGGRKPLDVGEANGVSTDEIPPIDYESAALLSDVGLDEIFADPSIAMPYDEELSEDSVRECGFGGADDDRIRATTYSAGRFLGRRRRDDTATWWCSVLMLPVGRLLQLKIGEEERLRRKFGMPWNTWALKANGAEPLKPRFTYAPFQGSVKTMHGWRRWAGGVSIETPRLKNLASRSGSTRRRIPSQKEQRALEERRRTAVGRRKDGLARGREKSIERANARARELAAEIQTMRSARLSYRAIASEFSRRGIPTPRAGDWTAATVRRVERRAAALDPQDGAIFAKS